MTMLVTIAFLMAVAGCFIMLGLSPFTFLGGLAGGFETKKKNKEKKYMY